MRRRPHPLNLLILALAAAIAASLDIALGPADIDLPRLWRVLSGGAPGTPESTIVWQIRAPRSVAACVVGGALALAGATFQALLRNPLAEPYILGVSGGAALGVVMLLVLGGAAIPVWGQAGASLAGALLAILAVFRVARAAGRRLDPQVMILAGVVIAVFFNAAIMLLLSFAEAESVRSAVVWTMGSLAAMSWGSVGILVAYVAPAAIILYAQARPLNLLGVGEETAAFLGTRVERVKTLCYFLASLLTAACVAVAGVIGFVGLVVPHTIRLVWGSDQRFLLPASLLAGATFLAGADVLARNLAAPADIPIGVVTAFIGVPFFLLLLRREVDR